LAFSRKKSEGCWTLFRKKAQVVTSLYWLVPGCTSRGFFGLFQWELPQKNKNPIPDERDERDPPSLKLPPPRCALWRTRRRTSKWDEWDQWRSPGRPRTFPLFPPCKMSKSGAHGRLRHGGNTMLKWESKKKYIFSRTRRRQAMAGRGDAEARRGLGIYAGSCCDTGICRSAPVRCFVPACRRVGRASIPPVKACQSCPPTACAWPKHEKHWAQCSALSANPLPFSHLHPFRNFPWDRATLAWMR
jgi:hypothetical protein